MSIAGYFTAYSPAYATAYNPGSTVATTTYPYFERDLVAYLLGLGIPVYPGHIPESASLPALSFLIVTASRPVRLAGGSGLVEVGLQIEVASRSYVDVGINSERLRQKLHGLLGKLMGQTYIFSITLDNQLTRYEPGVDASDRGVHSKISEFTVYHRETIFTP